MPRRGAWWAGGATAFAAAAGVGVVAGAVMVAVMVVVVGLGVAHLPGLVAVGTLAVAAFVAVVQALVSAFGVRGWVAALLLAAVQVAAAGIGAASAALPGPLGFVRPLLPLSWAVDAMRTAIDGGPGSIAPALVVLTGWLVAGLLVTLAVTAGAARREVPVAMA
jgi:putative membrane protein